MTEPARAAGADDPAAALRRHRPRARVLPAPRRRLRDRVPADRRDRRSCSRCSACRGVHASRLRACASRSATSARGTGSRTSRRRSRRTCGRSSSAGSPPPGCRGSRRSASSIRSACRRWPARRRSSRRWARSSAELSGLVLNERGWERLAATRLDRVNVTLAATESFNQRNGNATLAEAAARVERILAVADRPSTATISVSFGCPFEGERRSGRRRRPGRPARRGRRGGGRPRGHDRRRDAGAGPRAARTCLGPRCSGRRPLPRHAPHRRRVRLGGGRGRSHRPRRLGRRSRRLPVRAARDRERRHRGRALPPRPRGRRDRRRPRRGDRGREVARGAARPRAPGPRLPRLVTVCYKRRHVLTAGFERRRSAK